MILGNPVCAKDWELRCPVLFAFRRSDEVGGSCRSERPGPPSLKASLSLRIFPAGSEQCYTLKMF